MPSDTRALIDKINMLPAERISEVEDFVDFIGLREQQRGLALAAAAASKPASAAIWSNPEDDVYDAICYRFRSPARRPQKDTLPR